MGQVWKGLQFAFMSTYRRRRHRVVDVHVEMRGGQGILSRLWLTSCAGSIENFHSIGAASAETSKIPYTCAPQTFDSFSRFMFCQSLEIFFLLFHCEKFCISLGKKYIMHIMSAFQLKSLVLLQFLSSCSCFALLVLHFSLLLRLFLLSAVRFFWLKFFRIEQVFN